MCDRMVQDMKNQLLASPRKSLRKILQKAGIPYSTRQRAAKKAELHPYCMSVVQELLPMDLHKRVQYCLFPTFSWGTSGDFGHTWFTDEAWLHLSGYTNSQNMRVWAEENPHEIHMEPLYSKKNWGVVFLVL
jgi:hypothetical protein